MGTSERARRLLREFYASLLFFITGVIFILLAAFGRVYWGDNFDNGVLKYPGYGLIVVAVYVTVGVSIPRLLQGKLDKEDPDADKG